MPRRRLLRGQTPKPSEDITASATAPSEPVTVPAEPAPPQSTLRRSRRTAPTASPVVEEKSGNSDAGKWQEVVKDTGTETILNSPVIQLTEGSCRNLSPPKTNVEVTPQEDEKNSEAPATEVKETLRGRGRVGLKTKSLGIAVQKSESNSNESMLEGAKVETAPVETPACDSTKNLEKTDSLKVLKGTEDYNPKGTKSPPKKEHEELKENKPVFESKNVTDLEKKDVEAKTELKVSSSLDGREESGKERDDVHAPKEEVDEENAAEVQVKESAVEVRVEGSAAEVKVEKSAAEVEVEESAAGVKIEESAAEVQIEESPAGFKVEESAAEVKIILRDDVGEEKMECDVQDKQLCSTGEVINETSVVITAVKKEMDGEALLQNMEKVSDAPAKTTRGGRTLKRGADKESVNAPETKVLVKECKETQSQSTEIVQSIPSSIIRQRKEIKEILDKKTSTSEHSASVKMETDLQSTEKNIKDDNLEAQELTNLKNTEEIIFKDDTSQAQEVTDLQSTEKIIKDDTVQAQAVIDLQSTEKIIKDDTVQAQAVIDLQSTEKIIKDELFSQA
ncbi:titin-like [Macrobrachium nipponense]|uniref:titin-like n=1 Tax=Macrobrachium nipponense TaxID=159736 RepID=UPI0030C7E369